jgi:hypothetical protein
MEIKYTIQASGSVSVTFNGSYIPTQTYYVDWNAQGLGSHDMLANTTAQIDGFLQAGGGQPAPGRANPYRWTGQGRLV